MAGSITRKHLNKNYELSGVFASAADYMADILHVNTKGAEVGMVYYDTTLLQLRVYNGSSWGPAGLDSAIAQGLDAAAVITS
ncbi:unnamed protein product, partial [marine sediment metagenome]